MNEPDLFTPRQAREIRDAVLNDIEQAHLDWFSRALRIIDRLRFELLEFTAEDLGLEILARIEPPAKANCWGALTNAALKRGLIVPTGKRVPMLKKSSHGRKTDVYRSGKGK